MATLIEKIKKDKDIALKEYRKMKDKLKEFKDGEDDRMLLKTLRRKKKKLNKEDKKVKERLKKKEKELMKKDEIYSLHIIIIEYINGSILFNATGKLAKDENITGNSQCFAEIT
ncbi:6370_t:CDS:2 [Funneliformis mosseae]|uniref:6370_t:CDS:1 n=1 Tax=Funneliformis mosseae TaxID=27381 RepID=A0A9N9FDP8_FUNMO|nr:6370_t:CDS:2 [Funneliformis mosseae]